MIRLIQSMADIATGAGEGAAAAAKSGTATAAAAGGAVGNCSSQRQSVAAVGTVPQQQATASMPHWAVQDAATGDLAIRHLDGAASRMEGQGVVGSGRGGTAGLRVASIGEGSSGRNRQLVQLSSSSGAGLVSTAAVNNSGTSGCVAGIQGLAMSRPMLPMADTATLAGEGAAAPAAAGGAATAATEGAVGRCNSTGGMLFSVSSVPAGAAERAQGSSLMPWYQRASQCASASGAGVAASSGNVSAAPLGSSSAVGAHEPALWWELAGQQGRPPRVHYQLKYDPPKGRSKGGTGGVATCNPCSALVQQGRNDKKWVVVDDQPHKNSCPYCRKCYRGKNGFVRKDACCDGCNSKGRG